MALETLKNVETIDGFPVLHLEHRIDPETFEQVRKHVIVNHEENTISFKIQNGPIKEVGENGCQVDTLLAASILIITGLDEKFPCNENKKCLESLQEAYNQLGYRKLAREKREVEGTSNA
jgi:hypothetical protein